MQFDDSNSLPQLNHQTPLTDAVKASLVPFVLATPHHAPAEVVNLADSSHQAQNSRKLTEDQLEAHREADLFEIAAGQPSFEVPSGKKPDGV